MFASRDISRAEAILAYFAITIYASWTTRKNVKKLSSINIRN
jgi:hypothetical protein